MFTIFKSQLLTDIHPHSQKNVPDIKIFTKNLVRHGEIRELSDPCNNMFLIP